MRRLTQGEKLAIVGGVGILAIVGTRSTAQAAPRPVTTTTPGTQPGVVYTPEYPTTQQPPQTGVDFQGPVRGDPNVWRAQSQLSALGYDPGPIDGRWGAQTLRAVQDFERDYGRPVTSTLTQATIDAIEREYAQLAGTASTGDLSGMPMGLYRSRY